MNQFKFWMLGGLLVPVFLLYSQVQARDGPKSIPIHAPPPPSATPTQVPPLVIETDEFPTPTPRPTPTPTPTINPAIEVTANMKVRRVLSHKHILIRWIEMEKAPDDDFYNLTLDDLPLLMAIMAAESGGDPSVVSSAGAVGLFQIIPRDWLPFGGKVSQNSANVYVGLWMLDRILTQTGGDWRTTIAWWNCGQPKVEADECGSRGGVNFSDYVFEFWFPRMIEAMEE